MRDANANIFDDRSLPPICFDHIGRLTDSTGIYQHATYAIPNRFEGYCLDDNARALLLMLMAWKQQPDDFTRRHIPIYLSYIHHAQNPDGTFRNFMGFNRAFLDDDGTDDAFGRAIWALGYAVSSPIGDPYRLLARQLFEKSLPRFANIRSIRSIAALLLGLCHFTETEPITPLLHEQIKMLARRLQREYGCNRSPDWHWYEPLLAYDNGLIPLAVLRASRALHDAELCAIGMESMAFLERHTLRNGRISLIGNDGWYRHGSAPAQFDQQPVDAMTLVLLYREAYEHTGEQRFAQLMHLAFEWFLGVNDLGIPLFDVETQGCRDGLHAEGVNLNQGAESTLAFWISRLALEKT